MPWCEQCSRFYTQSTLSATGDCPSGHHVADPGGAPSVVQSTVAGRDETEKRPEKFRAPWHFYVLVAAVVIYLGWRLIQGIAWLLN